MKHIKYFIKYVELQTKVASFFPFWVAVCYYIAFLSKDNNGVNILNFTLFFIAMLCFDMATTAINHYTAFKHEKEDQSIYDSTMLQMMKELNLTMKHNKAIIFTLIGTAMILGLILVYLSNIGVLLLGALCFIIGIAYSYGPKPISHTPVGEFFSGGTMGVILPVIVLFTQYNYLPLNLNPFLAIVFFPLAFLIANILLGNNIADVEKDINNNRHTIVYYIGQQKGVLLLHTFNLLAMIFILVSIYFNFLIGYHYMLLLLIFPYLSSNINKFKNNISKQETFILIVKNFIIFTICYIITLVISIF